jgi:hypothetical protein
LREAQFLFFFQTPNPTPFGVGLGLPKVLAVAFDLLFYRVSHHANKALPRTLVRGKERAV